MYMNRNGLTVLFSWFLVFIWLVVIFYLSAQPAADSSNLSKKVTKVIIEIIPLDNEVSTTENLIAKLEPSIRKLGHFSEYFVLGLLVANAFRVSGVFGLKGFIFSLLFCILYAVSDEFHQYFVPGRSTEFKDIVMDTIGSFVGIGLYSLISRIRQVIANN